MLIVIVVILYGIILVGIDKLFPTNDKKSS